MNARFRDGGTIAQPVESRSIQPFFFDPIGRVFHWPSGNGDACFHQLQHLLFLVGQARSDLMGWQAVAGNCSRPFALNFYGLDQAHARQMLNCPLGLGPCQSGVFGHRIDAASAGRVAFVGAFHKRQVSNGLFQSQVMLFDFEQLIYVESKKALSLSFLRHSVPRCSSTTPRRYLA